MRPVQQFDSAVACIANFRKTRARLRNLKPPASELPPEPKPVVEVVPVVALPLPETAEVIPADIPPERPEVVTRRTMKSRTAIRLVAKFYNVKLDALISERRDYPIVHVRQIAMYVLRCVLNKSLHETGRQLGRDHTTALHATRKIERQLPTDAKLRDDIDVLKLKITERLTEEVV